MKIAINASFLRKPHTGIGQVTTHFLRTIQSMKKMDKKLSDVEFVLYLEQKSEEFSDFEQRVILPPHKRDDLVRKSWWESYIVPGMAEEDNVDVLISLYQCPTVAPNGVHHVMLVHDIIPRLFKRYRNNMRKRAYWWMTERGITAADDIVTVSEHTKRDLIKILDVPLEKITAAPIAVDPIFSKEISQGQSEHVLNKYGLEKGYIYTGGGLEQRKNVEVSLRAYAKALQKNPKLPQLVISGKLMPQLAPLITDVASLVIELKIEDRVHVLGFVEQNELPALYKNAVLFLFPSKYEGFGMPALEAMTVGTPVITTKSSSIPEVVGESAIYVDGTANDLSEKIISALDDSVQLGHLVVEGQKRSANFSWQKFTQSVLDKSLKQEALVVGLDES